MIFAPVIDWTRDERWCLLFYFEYQFIDVLLTQDNSIALWPITRLDRVDCSAYYRFLFGILTSCLPWKCNVSRVAPFLHISILCDFKAIFNQVGDQVLVHHEHVYDRTLVVFLVVLYTNCIIRTCEYGTRYIIARALQSVEVRTNRLEEIRAAALCTCYFIRDCCHINGWDRIDLWSIAAFVWVVNS